MTHNNHGWDDDEETIINFTPKPRVPQVYTPEDSASGHPPDALDLGLAHDASRGIEGAILISGPAAPVLTGAETPPASGLYGDDPVITRPSSTFTGVNATSSVVSSGAQDPYLAASGLQDALLPTGPHDAFPSPALQQQFTPARLYDPFPTAGLHDPRSPGGHVDPFSPSVQNEARSPIGQTGPFPVAGSRSDAPPVPPIPPLPDFFAVPSPPAVVTAVAVPNARRSEPADAPLPGFAPPPRPGGNQPVLSASALAASDPAQNSTPAYPITEPWQPQSAVGYQGGLGGAVPDPREAGMVHGAPGVFTNSPASVDSRGEPSRSEGPPPMPTVVADSSLPAPIESQLPPADGAGHAAAFHVEAQPRQPVTEEPVSFSVSPLWPGAVVHNDLRNVDSVDEVPYTLQDAPRPIEEHDSREHDAREAVSRHSTETAVPEIQTPHASDSEPTDGAEPPAYATGEPVASLYRAPHNSELAERTAPELEARFVTEPAEPMAREVPPRQALESAGTVEDAEAPSASKGNVVNPSQPIVHTYTADIDPPTVMDVPLVARRLFESLQAKEGGAGKQDGQTDAKEDAPFLDQTPFDKTPSPASTPAEPERAREAEVATGIDPTAEEEAHSIADEEWAALCEAAVAGSGAAPPQVPPLPPESFAPAPPIVTPPEPVAGAQVEAPVIPVEDRPRAAPVSAYSEMPSEPRIESEMERTNVHLPIRPSEAVADVAWLAVLTSSSAHVNPIYRLDSTRMEIGRAFDAPIFVDDRTVSTRHAAIRYERVNERFEFVLYDLASTNGSYLNGVLTHMSVLKDDDRIRVGETDLVFKKVGDPPAGAQ